MKWTRVFWSRLKFGIYQMTPLVQDTLIFGLMLACPCVGWFRLITKILLGQPSVEISRSNVN